MVSFAMVSFAEFEKIAIARTQDTPLMRHLPEELAQNGVRREAIPGWSRGARRTLCASKGLSASANPQSRSRDR
jgi:hypothetical protein